MRSTSAGRTGFRSVCRRRHTHESASCLHIQTHGYEVVVSADRDEFVVFGPNGFGAAIKEFRHRRGLTRQQLADEAEIYRSYLAKLETGATTEAIEQMTRAFVAPDLEIVVRERSRT